MILEDPLFYAVAVPAVLLSGISKGGFGGGLGILTVPLLALVVPPTQAAAIMLPILCAIDLVGLRAFWGRHDRADIGLLLAGAVVGIVIGALTFKYLTADAIRILLGLIAVAFTLRYYAGRYLARGRAPAPPAPRSVAKAGFWSLIAGVTSFIAHAGGPPLSVYLLPRRLEKTTYQATTVVFFAVVNYVKLVPYALLGQFPAVNLGTAAALTPVAILGTVLGVWLHRRVSDRIFYEVAYACVLATGAKLLWDGLANTL